jgi:hypothetical protein
MKTPTDFFEEYQQRFSNYSDQELVNAFNEEIGKPGWVGARGSYLVALRLELNHRQIDYSAIGDETGLSLNTKVYLNGKRLEKNILE